MVVLDVIPLAKNIPDGTLSYRHTRPLLPGALIEVPLRNKRVPALVVASTSVRDAKATLKRASFQLRGGSLRELGALPPEFVSAAREVALYHATTLGSVLSGLMREFLLIGIPEKSETGTFREELCEDTYANRLARYETLVTNALSRETSVLLIAPTQVEAERLCDHLSSYQPMLISGEIPVKKREPLVVRALATPSFVIATPAYSWLPLPKLSALILERAGAGSYTRVERPYLDIRVAANAYAKARGCTIIMGDYPLPMSFREAPAHAVTATVPSKARIIDVRTKESDESPKRPFTALPPAVIDAIGKTLGKGGRVAVLSVRKGFAPAVVCRDCGTIVRDEYGRALAFAKTGASPILRSADGKTVRDADVVCSTCGSWNLLSLGVGIERVTEELATALPEFARVVFDPTKARSATARKKLCADSRAAGTLLIGTESMLPYLDPLSPIELAVIASADSLLAFPFWSARERLVRLGLASEERAKMLTVVTRSADETAFTALTHPTDDTFWKEEALLRKALSYPPYARLIVFHADVTEAKLEETFDLIRAATEGLAITRLPDRKVSPTRVRLAVVAKVTSKEWPNETLSARLAALPPSIEVRIDSDSLW